MDMSVAAPDVASLWNACLETLQEKVDDPNTFNKWINDKYHMDH